jgi:hypothetical protein
MAKTEQGAGNLFRGGGVSRLEPAAAILLGLLLAAALISSIILADATHDRTLLTLSFLLFFSALVVIAWNARRRPFLAFAVILFWLLLQNIVLVPLSKLVEPSTVRLLIGAKEVFFLLLISVSVLHFAARLVKHGGGTFSPLWTDLVGLGFLAILIIAFVRGQANPLLTRTAYLRFFAILPVCYFVGRSLPLEAQHLKAMFRLTVGAGVVLSLFGLAELFLLGDPFWKKAGAIEFFAAKGTALWTAASVKFYNWYTWDFGFPMRRMVSLILEPTTLAELLAGTTLLAAFSGFFPGLKRKAAVFLLLTGLVLSFGKGGWVIFMVGAFIILLKEHKTLAMFIGVLFLAFGALFILFNIQSGGNVPIHVRGFTEGIRHAAGHPFGAGLGSGGVYSALFALKRSLPGKESTLVAMLVQAGLPGTLAYVLFFLALIIQLSRLARPDEDSPDLSPVRLAARAVSGCLAGIFLVTFFSESAVGVIGTGVFLVIAGSLQNFYPGPFRLKL